MAKFIKTKTRVQCEKTWYSTTYLIVKCTAAGKQQLHYYRNQGKGGLHAEELFIEDFKASTFPANSKFELYMNWTPCVDKCCDILLSTFTGTELMIYAVALHNNNETAAEIRTALEKFRLLKDKRILIKSLDREQFLSLVSDHRKTLEPKLASYNEVIKKRDEETAKLLGTI